MAHIEIPDGESPERLRLWQMVPRIDGGIDAMRRAVYSGETKLSIEDPDPRDGWNIDIRPWKNQPG